MKQFSLIVALMVLGQCSPVSATSVAFPMHLDFQQLRTLFIHVAYTDPGQSIQLADAATECRYIHLSDPRFSTHNGLLLLETLVTINVAVEVLGKCVTPVRWSGRLILEQEPFVTPEWLLGFRMVDSYLVGSNHQPVKVAGVLWALVKSLAHIYLDSVRINLAPPVTNLKSFLEPLFDSGFGHKSMQKFAEMQPGAIAVTAKGLSVDILTEVDDMAQTDQPPEHLTESELERLIDTWQIWDAFLVHIITELAGQRLSDDDRAVLFATLLDTRHIFVHELMAGTLNHDFVRRQFVSAWRDLAPVFRRHLSEGAPDRPVGNTLGYLSFFTASDALTALDQIGPSLGIEISYNGFIRLARLLSDDQFTELVYTDQINLVLRDLLGMGAPLAISEDLFIPPPLDFEIIREGDPDNWDDVQSLMRPVGPAFERIWGYGRKVLTGLGVHQAWAQAAPAVQMARLRQWLVTRDNFNDYLARILKVLDRAGGATLKKSNIDSQYHDLYRDIIQATAWQESCFRQFHTRNRELTYIRSYNNTSVGIMQINEKVWRGIYNIENLRWDIDYNARAGAEIADEYLTRYAFRRMDPQKPLPPQTIAQVLYAMYNGGPGQYARFLARHQKGELFESDRLFLEKYEWVTSDQLDMVRRCLFGG